MPLKKVNTLLVMLIILCSTSIYNLSMIGPGQKAAEIFGMGLVVFLFLLHIIYGNTITITHNFKVFTVLILASFFTSAVMARYTRYQSYGETFYAQRALFYYMFYFLLHQMKIKVSDLEKIFVIFGVVYMLLYLVQFTLYPKIIFDVFMVKDRGTVRVYLPGSDYIAVSIFYFAQKFFRTNHIKYLIFLFGLYSIFILLGGRQTMILMAFCLVLFLLFSKRVKSRFGLTIVIGAVIVLAGFLFKDIIDQLVITTQTDLSRGKDYARVRSVVFFLTDFFLSPWAYITGNGVAGHDSQYGKEIMTYAKNGLFLGDIGTIGHYVMYGAFFIIGVIGICIKVFASKFENNYSYLKYMFIGITLSLLTGPGFGNSDFIVFLCCAMYIMDVSLERIRLERLSFKELKNTTTHE